MKKSKGQTVDLLYTNNKENNKKQTKRTKSVGTNSVRPSKNKKKTKKRQINENETINLDNEIIIGLTPKKEETKKTTKSKNSKIKEQQEKNTNNVGPSNARPQKRNKANTNKKNSNNKKTKSTVKKQNPKKKRKNKIVKWIIIIILLAVAIILFMMSSVFNIKQIVVLNNKKVSTEEIIKLSNLTTGVNMFKTTNGTIKNGVKANAYIEDVTVKRNINGTVILDIKERNATYMLKSANGYVYINNQGYMLEISEEKLELPIITGFSTSSEEINAGNRLNNDDLMKLDDVIKIIETSKNTSLASIITEIDISKSPDYTLTVASEQKTVKTGDMTNINIKLQMATQVFNAEKGKVGEIYFQEDGKKAVFKEEVSR